MISFDYVCVQKVKFGGMIAKTAFRGYQMMSESN